MFRMTASADLRAAFGEIDIYLFDQLLRGRFDNRRTVLDAGCGDGRNLHYLLKAGFECFGIDADAGAIEQVRRRATHLAPTTPAANFVTGNIERLPWADGSMNAIICSAVLHFSVDEPQFGRMMTDMWRVLAPGGLFFARLASNIGLERVLGERAGRRMRLPDGTDRFVVDEQMLLDWTERLGARLIDPIKTTNVQQQRCMTTWCLHKAGGHAT
jgi:SAM-dependent methyltransferase